MDKEEDGRCRRQEAAAFAIGCCLIALGTAFVASRYIEDAMVRRLQHKLVLRPNSTMLDEWVHPTAHDYMKFYIFNVTNADAIIRGEKPVLREIGPYTYRTVSPRIDIEFFYNDTVSFRNNRTLHFEPSMSVGSEDDLYHHVNVPLLAVYQRLSKREFGSGETLAENQGLFVSHAVKDILFGYVNGNPLKAESLSGFGPFRGFNMDDGLFLVNTGAGYFSDSNTIQRWNGKTHLPYWSTEYANMLNGTDGLFLKPGIVKHEQRYIFVPLMRRSVKLEYEAATKINRVDLFRYHFANDSLANASAVPDNAGYCVPKSHCLESGLLYEGGYEDNTAPLFISLPHFYNGDEGLREGVEGLKPSKALHDSFIFVEPTSGAVFHSQRRLQFSVHLEQTDLPYALKDVRPAYVPLFWLSDEATINNSTGVLISYSMFAVALLIISLYFLIAVGTFIVVLIILTRLKHRCGSAGIHLRAWASREPLVEEDVGGEGDAEDVDGADRL